MKASSLTESLGFIGTAWGKLRDSWKAMDTGKHRLIIGLAVVVMIMAGFAVWLLNFTSYGVLYTNLSTGEAGEILAQLQEMGIDAKPDGSDTILVPQDSIDTVRMELAAAGLPRNEQNLDILDKGTGFGVTEDDKSVYRRYQLQQDLQNAIKTFDGVSEARVSLIIPKESVFLIEDQKTAAAAAVLLTLKPGAELTSGNVKAISELVQHSVPDLVEDNISIIDSNMNVLNTHSDTDESLAEDRQNLQQQVSDRLQGQVMALLQPVFGVGKVLAEVNVTLDFDQATVESIRFEPAEGSSEGIIANIDSIREVASGANDSSAGAGTDSNGTGITTYPVVGVDNSVYEKNSEQITYEINTIKESLVKAKGSVKQLSVSVLLDSRDSTAADYAENVRNLVSSAIGVSGDTITVESLPFNGTQEMDSTWEEYNRVNEKMVQWERTRFFLLLGAGVVVFLVTMALILRALRGGSRESGRDIIDMLPPNRLNAALREIKSGALHEAIASVPMIPLAELQSETAQERKAIEQYIETNPELVANILRSWLAEETR